MRRREELVRVLRNRLIKRSEMRRREELVRVLRNRLIKRSEMRRREELVRVLRSGLDGSKNPSGFLPTHRTSVRFAAPESIRTF
jgi:hypothetical protein